MKKIKKLGKKIVITIHDLLPFNKKFYDVHFLKKIYSNADIVISQAMTNINDLISKFKVSKNKISYIPHGHYMDYAEKVTVEESRKFLGLPLDKKIILFFGQIKKVKGVDILIKAMRYVIAEHPNVMCLIAGKVWKDNFSQYDKLIMDLDLQHYIKTDIKFIPDDEVKYYFNAADIVALPYRKIYQSGVVQLAYAYEKPVVATTEGEFVNVIKNGETGLLVVPDDEKAFAGAINQYLDDPIKAIEFGKKGREDLKVRMSWDLIAEQTYNLYKKILA